MLPRTKHPFTEKTNSHNKGTPVSATFFDNSPIDFDEWLTSKEAAQYLRVSVGSLRNMVSNGQIPHFKLFGRNRFHRKDLRQLLKKSRGESHGI